MYQFIENLHSDKAFYFHRGWVTLYALLGAAGIQHGDEVILQSFTCPAVPYPIVRAGAKPIYVDIDPNTLNIDPDKIEEKISPKTKVIVIQHTFGVPVDMDRVLDIARAHNLLVFEDACHAFGSKYKGREVGTFGDAVFYSFGWHKPVIIGIGGATIVNNPEFRTQVAKTHENDFVTPSIKEAITLYAQYFAYAALFTPARFWTMKEIYRRMRDFRKKPQDNNHHEEIKIETFDKITGRRLIPYQKSRLLKKLRYFNDHVLPHLQWVADQYATRLPHKGFDIPQIVGDLEPIYYKYPIFSEHKAEIFEQARAKKIELSDMFGSPRYPPDRAANWKALNYEPGMCPIAERVSDRIIALPVHEQIREKEIDKTVHLLESFR